MLRACMPTPATTRYTLRPHPASPATAAIGLGAAVAVRRGRLELLYELDADLARVERMGVLATLPKPVPLQTFLQRLEQARRGAVVWFVCGAAERVSRLMEFVRDHGCTPLPFSAADPTPSGPTPLLAVLANAPEDETEAWALAHPELPLVRLPASLEALATALEARLERFDLEG